MRWIIELVRPIGLEIRFQFIRIFNSEIRKSNLDGQKSDDVVNGLTHNTINYFIGLVFVFAMFFGITYLIYS